MEAFPDRLVELQLQLKDGSDARSPFRSVLPNKLQPFRGLPNPSVHQNLQLSLLLMRVCFSILASAWKSWQVLSDRLHLRWLFAVSHSYASSFISTTTLCVLT
jgi:hypothetical protein